MAALWPTLGHYWGDCLARRMFVIGFEQFRPGGQREVRNDVGSLSSVERLVEYELGAFQF